MTRGNEKHWSQSGRELIIINNEGRRESARWLVSSDQYLYNHNEATEFYVASYHACGFFCMHSILVALIATANLYFFLIRGAISLIFDLYVETLGLGGPPHPFPLLKFLP